MCIFETNHPQYELGEYILSFEGKSLKNINQECFCSKLCLSEDYLVCFNQTKKAIILSSVASNHSYDNKLIHLPITDINLMNYYSENKKISFLLYCQNKQIFIHEIQQASFLKYPEIKDTLHHNLSENVNPSIVRVFEEASMLILISESVICFYTLEEQEESTKIELKKGNLYLREIPKFTQHRSTIIHAEVCRSNGLLVSLDSCRKIFIINLNGKIEVSQSFRLTKLSHCEEVKSMRIHQMCYIVILTTLNYIYVYSLMGDLIMGLNPSSISLLDKDEDIICI